ncbi:hypothetical protein P4S72_05740 [Vibrio sp. PP-XX7]
MKLKIVKHAPGIITYESDKGIQLNASPDELLKKNVLLMFESKDRAYLVSWRAVISRKKMSTIFWIGGLFAFYLVFLLLAIPMSPDTVHLFHTAQPAGILIFP